MFYLWCSILGSHQSLVLKGGLMICLLQIILLNVFRVPQHTQHGDTHWAWVNNACCPVWMINEQPGGNYFSNQISLAHIWSTYSDLQSCKGQTPHELLNMKVGWKWCIKYHHSFTFCIDSFPSFLPSLVYGLCLNSFHYRAFFTLC